MTGTRRFLVALLVAGGSARENAAASHPVPLPRDASIGRRCARGPRPTRPSPSLPLPAYLRASDEAVRDWERFLARLCSRPSCAPSATECDALGYRRLRHALALIRADLEFLRRADAEASYRLRQHLDLTFGAMSRAVAQWHR